MLSSYYGDKLFYYSRFYAICKISLLFLRFILLRDNELILNRDDYDAVIERFIFAGGDDSYAGFNGGSLAGRNKGC
jgi:hypothetical protein